MFKEKRVDFIQRQYFFLQTEQEPGIRPGAGTKWFHGQGVAARLAQMLEKQCGHDCFADACVRASDKDNFCHWIGIDSEAEKFKGAAKPGQAVPAMGLKFAQSADFRSGCLAQQYSRAKG